MEHLTEILAAGGGALATAGTVLVAWIGWRRARDTSGAIHDERVSPALLERIKTLEERDDAKAAKLEALSAETAECMRDRERAAEREERCHRELEEVKGHVLTLQEMVSRRDEGLTRKIRVIARETMQSTPPGSWVVDEDEIERLRLEEESRED